MDLPAPVRDLAERLGARRQTGSRASFRQSGTLRNLGQTDWMRFTATQWISADELSFRWKARVGPFGVIGVEDALIDAHPVGRVTALGLIPLQRAQVSDPLLKGELQRYLAELPWAPDAIISNPALKWDAVDRAHLIVSASLGDIMAEVHIHLDADGLPERTFAIRPAMESGQFVEREWHGVFSDYHERQDRLVPHRGAVAWTYEGERFEVWKGAIEEWRKE